MCDLGFPPKPSEVVWKNGFVETFSMGLVLPTLFHTFNNGEDPSYKYTRVRLDDTQTLISEGAVAPV